jgi:hypothetical protein
MAPSTFTRLTWGEAAKSRREKRRKVLRSKSCLMEKGLDILHPQLFYPKSMSMKAEKRLKGFRLKTDRFAFSLQPSALSLQPLAFSQRFRKTGNLEL